MQEQFFEEEKYEGEEEYDEELGETEQSEFTKSEYSNFDPENETFIVPIQIKPDTKATAVVVPAGTFLKLCTVSLNIQNQLKGRHIINLNHNGQTFTIARLIPDRVETQVLDVTIETHGADELIYLDIQGKNVGDVDILAQICKYQTDDEEKENTDSVSQDEQDQQQYKKEKQPTKQKKEIDDKLDLFYEQQSIAKYQEYKLQRAANLTSVAYKDIKVGTGACAVQNKVVQIKYTILVNNKVLQQTAENQNFAFKLNTNEVSKGIYQLIMGMREGGVRDATGDYLEMLDEKRPEKVRVVAELVSVQ